MTRDCGLPDIYIPKHMNPYPHDFEISAAAILSRHFQTKVSFVERKMVSKTSDLKINDAYWEIKSPLGGSSRTIQNNLRKADNQAENIVIDLRRCKLHGGRAIGYIKTELSRASRIKRLVVITKTKKVVTIL